MEIFTVEMVSCRRFGLFMGVGVAITSFWSWLVRKCGVVKGGECVRAVIGMRESGRANFW